MHSIHTSTHAHTFTVVPANWTSTWNELKRHQTDHLRSHEIICFHLHRVTHSWKNYTDRACFCLIGPRGHPPGIYAGLRWDLIKLSDGQRCRSPIIFLRLVLGSDIGVGIAQVYLHKMGCLYKKAILNVDSLQGHTFSSQKHNGMRCKSPHEFRKQLEYLAPLMAIR